MISQINEHTISDVGKLRIYLADDHPMMREGLQAVIENDPDFTLVGTASDGKEAIKGIGALQPDIVLMDILMPNMNGLDSTKQIKQRHPQTKVIILTTYQDSEGVRKAVDVGADGYVLKRDAAKSIIEAIKTVARGGRYFSPFVEGLIHNQEIPVENLTLEDILDRALAEIVGGFCHDIGNDLALCLMHLDASKYSEARKVGANAEASLRGLHMFVRQFYTGGAVHSSLLAPASFETFIREICGHAVHSANISLHIESFGFDDKISLPSPLLRHLITPLAHNAIEAISAGKRESGLIKFTISIEGPEKLLHIVVEDNGIGWNDGCKVIEAALKNGQSQSSKGNNRGFGLQNVWRLLSRIGGDLNLSTSGYGGAKVDLYIEIAHATTPKRRSSPALGSKKNIDEFKLTSLQKEILELLVEGRSTKEIAHIMNMSSRTVTFHKYTIMETLKVKTTEELIAYLN